MRIGWIQQIGRNTALVITVSGLLCIMASTSVSAQSSLPEQTRISANHPAVLQRCATVPMKALGGLIHIGDAALYLNQCSDAAQVLHAIPKQFTIALARDASGQRLRRMAVDLLEENLEADVQQQALFACITDAYIDAEKGDRYDISYLPDVGLALRLNGETLAQCPDTEQAPRYFSIWFGDKPFNQKLRDRLIEQATQRMSVSSSP